MAGALGSGGAAKGWLFGVALLLAAGGVGAGVVYNHKMHLGVAVAHPESMPVPQYRDWVYLSSGLNMSYMPTPDDAHPPNHDGAFDNVFVNPEAYRSFKQTGLWPDQTTMVLENRLAEDHQSINRDGRTQGEKVTSVVLHVKSAGRWTFYAQDTDGAEHLISRKADCYRCHDEHAAVDTTFVQFYPTLLPVAEEKHVLSEAYLADVAETVKTAETAKARK